MQLSEAAEILTMCIAFDRRTVGEADVTAWHLVLGDIEKQDAAIAVRDHYTTSDEWLMPATLRRLAVAARNRRTLNPQVAAPGCWEPDDTARKRLAQTVTADGRLMIGAGQPPTETGRRAARAVAELATEWAIEQREHRIERGRRFLDGSEL